VYNEIRVFVSAYVWMTGFGNFLYFDKKQDFSAERAASMWIRINYFPILLSFFLGVDFDLFYIVPLHTTAFFITMITCYVAKVFGTRFPDWPHWKKNAAALAACLLFHVVLFETPAVNLLLIFGKEIHFRFQADKYSAVLGIVSGYFWSRFTSVLQWCHTPDEHGKYTEQQVKAAWAQRAGGVGLLALWWLLFGHIQDKYAYNPIHPFVFWIPIAGWLMLRNSSKYLTEVHSTALEFFGRITLETYVLQFHLFMCKNVQHIPVVLPGSGKDGSPLMKFLNMLLCGVIFVSTAYWARTITITTQTTVTDLLILLRKGSSSKGDRALDDHETMALKNGDSGDGRTSGSTTAPSLQNKQSNDV
jgi:N-acetylneuraminate 9-O-acetyltransferase